jgi:hypothetical protein
MGNNTQNSKLDDAIKKSLSDYEARYDAADWSRMESMLDAAPRAAQFKWSYVLNSVIVVAVLGGCWLVYNTISSEEKVADTKTAVEAPAPKAVIVSPTPVTKASTPVADSAPVSTPPVITPPVITNVTTPNATAATPVTKNRNKPVTPSGTPATATEAPRFIGMGNEPVFGDMLDSSKGIIGTTKEKEETRKAAKERTDYPVGWNSFMLSNVNPDSIRKYRERMKADSTKKN